MLIHKVMLLIPSLSVSHVFPTLFFTFLISVVQKQQSYFCVCVLEKKIELMVLIMTTICLKIHISVKIRNFFVHPHILNVLYEQATN